MVAPRITKRGSSTFLVVIFFMAAAAAAASAIRGVASMVVHPNTATSSTTTGSSSSSRRSTGTPSTPLRAVLVGSGSDGMSDPRIVQVILDMATRTKKEQEKQDTNCNMTTMTTTMTMILHVLYLGTATYDLPQFREQQTQWFTNKNNMNIDNNNKKNEVHCQVSTLELVHQTPTPEQVAETIGKADIIIVGGGNTLFAVDRWKAVPQVVPSLQAAMERGAILTGGSAGAICWCEGGHSDSMDPDTYYPAMMQKFDTGTAGTGTAGGAAAGGGKTATTPSSIVDESCTTTTSTSSRSSKKTKDWKYIRVPGLGFLPGVIMCPHHDRIQSNGVLRAHDFDQMLLRQQEHHQAGDEGVREQVPIGIGIDHWAALVVEGKDDSYRVVSLPGRPGSVVYNDDDDDDDNVYDDRTILNGGRGVPSLSPDSKGVPGIWIKKVQNGKVEATLLAPSGKWSEVVLPAVLRTKATTTTTTEILGPDREAVEQCRRENPDRTKLII